MWRTPDVRAIRSVRPEPRLVQHGGIFAHENPVRAVADRIEQVAPEWIHAMHGATIKGEALHYYASALREQEFAYQGLLLGREVGAPAEA